jgi:predicted dehydrogenase
MESGAIGRPISARAVWGEYLPDWHPWEDYRQSYSARSDLGGGVLLTLSHPFDYLRWFFGDVGAVMGAAQQSGALDVDVEDTADVLLSFRSGVTASVHLDYHQRPAEHHLTVVGTRGTLRWDNRTGETRWWPAADSSWQSRPAPQGFERNDMFIEEMRHFVDVAEGRAEPVCTLSDGTQALRVALAARQSAETGQRVELS